MEKHSYPDHCRYSTGDIDFGDDRPVLMTEKDAVKCRYFARGNEWYVPVEVDMKGEFRALLDKLLEQRVPQLPDSHPALQDLPGD